MDTEIVEVLEANIHFIESWFAVKILCSEMKNGDVIVLGVPFFQNGGLIFGCLLEAATHLGGAVAVLSSIEKNPGIYLTRLHAAQF